jgi:PEP-CTERM motif
MLMIDARLAIPLSLLGCLVALPATADPFSFSTGTPDGRIGTLSRPASASGIQTETADDFILGHATSITNATFYGLIPTGSSISEVEIEFYHVFPGDSADPPSGNVPARKNSPGDVEIGSATRDSGDGSLTFGSSLVDPSFDVLNTVVAGIHKLPGVFTSGEGPTTGEEVLIRVDFTTPVDLPADHYFFRPEALLSSGNFLFLSAAGPTLFAGDLQSWTRNDDLAPDWLRIGTDITHQGPFNGAFSLAGAVVPEPSTWAMMLLGFAGLGFAGYRASRRTGAAA